MKLSALSSRERSRSRCSYLTGLQERSLFWLPWVPFESPWASQRVGERHERNGLLKGLEFSTAGTSCLGYCLATLSCLLGRVSILVEGRLKGGPRFLIPIVTPRSSSRVGNGVAGCQKKGENLVQIKWDHRYSPYEGAATVLIAVIHAFRLPMSPSSPRKAIGEVMLRLQLRGP